MVGATSGKLFRRGKVRDVYDLGDRLLMVASDRLSAFDCVLPTPIPGKGRILTRISALWFGRTADICPNHFIEVKADQPNAMLVKKAERVDVECVARGYLAGSAWKEYRETGRVAGHELPTGLREADALPEPIFTPATKADAGHDENITRERLAEAVGRDTAAKLESLTLALYRRAARALRSEGLILADTKFEFGFLGSDLIAIDEMLTPDSSRLWDAKEYRPGSSPASFDKQFVRDYLEAVGWDKRPPAPALPPEVAEGTRRRYEEALARMERLTP